MPTYEYSCPKCETVYAKFRKISERNQVVICEVCEDTECQQTFSSSAVVNINPRDEAVPTTRR